LHGKSIGGKRIRSGDPLQASAERGGPIVRPAGRPYIGLTLFLRKEGLARPTQKMKAASWFFRAKPLLPGRAMPEIQEGLQLLAEK